jgi:hypothetical protein
VVVLDGAVDDDLTKLKMLLIDGFVDVVGALSIAFNLNWNWNIFFIKRKIISSHLKFKFIQMKTRAISEEEKHLHFANQFHLFFLHQHEFSSLN